MYGFAITVDGRVVYACSNVRRLVRQAQRFAAVANAKIHTISAGRLSAGAAA